MAEGGQVGTVEVEVRADVSNFERGLDQARVEAEAFESRAKQLFGNVSNSVKALSKDMEMTARSTRLFTSEMENAANQVVADLVRMQEERKRLGLAFQQRLNLTYGLGGPQVDLSARAEDIRIYGESLDALRAKFVPLFAIQKQYQASVDEINAAHRVGAFGSIAEYNDALTRTKLIYEATVASAARLGTSLKINSLQMGNIAAQFNDIAVTMAMGMNSWMIALQQGTQINQVIRGMRIAEVGKMLGGAFLELLNPIALATIAIIGFGGAAIQWLLNMKGETEKLSKLLKEQADIVKDLGNAYGDVAKQAQAATNAQAGLTSFALRSLRNETQLRLAMLREIAGKGEGEKPTPRFLTSIGTIVGPRTQGAVGEVANIAGYRTALKLDEQFKPFTDIIVKYMETIKAGTPDVLAFRKAVEERWALDPGNAQLTDAASILSKLTDALVEAAEKIREFELIRRRLFETVQPSGLLLSQGIINREDMANLSKFNAQLEGTISRMKEIAAIDISGISAKSPQELANIARRRAEAEHPSDEGVQERALRIQIAETQALTAAEYELAQAAEARMRARQQTLDQANLNIKLVGATAAETAKLRYEYDKIQEVYQHALDTHTKVNQQEVAQIHATAAAYGDYVDQLNKVQLQYDIMFERSQIFLTKSEQAIRSRIKGAGLDPDLNPAIAAQLRYNQELERTKDTWQDIFDNINSGVDSIVDTLFDGTKSFEETFKEIGRKFARLMFDLSITNPLKNWLTGGEFKSIADLGIFGKGASSGRGGGFGGIVGKLLGAQQAVATMQVQAATVIVNGGVLGGIPGVPTSVDDIIKKIGPNTPQSSQKMLDQLGSVLGAKGSGDIVSALKSAGQTAQGIPLSQITAGNLTGKVATEYAGRFQGLLNELKARGYPISSLGEGGYSFRGVGGRSVWTSPSQHATGEALDINPAINLQRMGARGNWAQYGIDPSALARKYNLEYGGDWRLPDTMHFQVPRGGRLRGTMPGDIPGVSNEVTSSVTALTDASKVAAASLQKVGLSGFEAVKGLTDAAGGLTQFGTMLSSFMGKGGGSGASWFQNLIGIAGSAAGAISGMQAISPGATSAIIAGGALGPKGLYQTGGFTGGNDSGKIAGLVHQKEFVFDANSTARIGVHNLEKIRQSKLPGAISVPPTWSADNIWRRGSGTATINEGSMKAKIINVFDPSVVGDYLSTESGERVIMNVMRRNGR